MTEANPNVAAEAASSPVTEADRSATEARIAESVSAQTTTASSPASAEVLVPERVFRMGAIELPDPDRTLDPLEALRLHALNYPHLATATLSEPQLDGERLVYEVEKPPVKTKG